MPCSKNRSNPSSYIEQSHHPITYRQQWLMKIRYLLSYLVDEDEGAASGVQDRRKLAERLAHEPRLSRGGGRREWNIRTAEHRQDWVSKKKRSSWFAHTVVEHKKLWMSRCFHKITIVDRGERCHFPGVFHQQNVLGKCRNISLSNTQLQDRKRSRSLSEP